MRQIPVESLLAESAWVRSLAARLLYDQSQVDDVVQQTWLVALQRQATPRQPRAWLAGVLRNVVRRQVRSSQRRERRETGAAGTVAHTVAAPTDELVDQAELFRAVVDAVLELHEPFRATIVLRYFKGWEPREIAAQQGVSATTVRTRLHRAHELLKGRLDGCTGGDRRQWALGLIPLVAGHEAAAQLALVGAGAVAASTAAATTTAHTAAWMGALSMTGKSLAMITAVALVGLTAWWVGGASDVTPPAGTASVPVLVVASGETGPPETKSASDESGSAFLIPQDVSPEPLAALVVDAPPAAATAPLGAVLYGAVTDGVGALVFPDRTFVRLRGPSGVHRSCSIEDGAYSFAGLTPGSWSLSLDADGYKPASCELELSAGPPLRHDLVLTGSLVLPVFVRTPTGESTQALIAAAAVDSFHAVSLEVLATHEPLERDLPASMARLVSQFGVGSWRANGLPWDRLPASAPADCDGLLEVSALPVWASLVARHVVLATQQVSAGAKEVVFVLPLERVEEVLGSLVLTVVDAHSRTPIEGARVHLTDGSWIGAGQVTGSDGRMRFEGSPPGPMELEVIAAGHETLRRVVDLVPGQTTDLGELPLHPATVLSGRVVDGQGNPVSGSLVALPVDRFERDAGPYRRRQTLVDADGSFRVNAVGRERYLLWMIGKQWACRPQVVDARAGDVADIVLLVDPPVTVVLRADWPEQERHSLSLLTDDGLSLRIFRLCQGGVTRTERLAPGDYRVLIDGTGPGQRFSLVEETVTLVLAP